MVIFDWIQNILSYILGVFNFVFPLNAFRLFGYLLLELGYIHFVCCFEDGLSSVSVGCE